MNYELLLTITWWVAYKKILFCMSAVCNESFPLLNCPSLQLQVYLHERKEYYIKIQHKRHCNQYIQLNCSSHLLRAFQIKGLFPTKNVRNAWFHTDSSLGQKPTAAFLPEAGSSHSPSCSQRCSDPPRADCTALSSHAIPWFKHDKFTFFQY